MSKIFVMDSEQGRIPLNVVRSLGRKGINSKVGGSMSVTTPIFSTYCESKFTYPSIANQPDEFRKFITNFIQEEKPEVIFPLMNDSVEFFSKHKEEFSKFTKIPLADYDIMSVALDKEKTLRVAQELGIPCPKSFFPKDETSLTNIMDQLQFPVIIKPKKAYGSSGVHLCKNEKELIKFFRKVSSIHGAPLVQEYIPPGGDALGVSCLFNYSSDARAIFSHKRLREYPQTGGPSTLRESISSPKAEEFALKLLKKMNWFGLAMVEFKVDPRDNIPKLMEINPRFWGSISLPMYAGVDFPYLLYQLVTQGDVEEVKNYKLGIKSRWVGGDFLYLLTCNHKLKFFFEFIKFGQKDTFCEDFAKDDPLPALSRLLSIFYVFNRKIRGGLFKSYYKNKN